MKKRNQKEEQVPRSKAVINRSTLDLMLNKGQLDWLGYLKICAENNIRLSWEEQVSIRDTYRALAQLPY